jgi:hypothetical protein
MIAGRAAAKACEPPRTAWSTPGALVAQLLRAGPLRPLVQIFWPSHSHLATGLRTSIADAVTIQCCTSGAKFCNSPHRRITQTVVAGPMVIRPSKEENAGNQLRWCGFLEIILPLIRLSSQCDTGRAKGKGWAVPRLTRSGHAALDAAGLAQGGSALRANHRETEETKQATDHAGSHPH